MKSLKSLEIQKGLVQLSKDHLKVKGCVEVVGVQFRFVIRAFNLKADFLLLRGKLALSIRH